MGKKEIRAELKETAKSQLPEEVITIALLEHYIDLVGTIVKDLSQIVDPAKVTPEMQSKLDMLDGLLEHSSVDFANIENPMQAYKIPKAIETKAHTRTVQSRYLKRQIELGVFASE
jgi:predicted translin family RNA/ssDNA-binding protein